MVPLPVIAPAPPRQDLRFGLPPSLGEEAAGERARRLEAFLGAALQRRVEVVVAASYDALARELLAGKLDAAWAPPYVCARVEAMGVQVLVRGVRGGSSSYRAALICRAGAQIKLDRLDGLRALWADPDSVGGYLLAVALLRSKGIHASTVFTEQGFAGSYRAAVEGLLAGKADLTSVFAPLARAGRPDATGIEEVAPGKSADISVVAFTEETPNDGVAVSVTAPIPTVKALEASLLKLQGSEEGSQLLRDIFNAERFEPAPRMGYRALYRVALSSL